MATKLLAQALFELKVGNPIQCPNSDRYLIMPWAVKYSFKTSELSLEIYHVDSSISLDKSRFVRIKSEINSCRVWTQFRHTLTCMQAFASGWKVQKNIVDRFEEIRRFF